MLNRRHINHSLAVLYESMAMTDLKVILMNYCLIVSFFHNRIVQIAQSRSNYYHETFGFTSLRCFIKNWSCTRFYIHQRENQSQAKTKLKLKTAKLDDDLSLNV